MADKEFPPIHEEALNIAKAVGRVAQAAITRTKIKVSKEVQELRITICKTSCCGNYEENDGRPRCRECGCYLKYKTKLTTETCPLGLWKKEETKDGSV